MRLPRILFAALPVCAACTFTGLGNYDIATCPSQLGSTTVIAKASQPADLTFSNTTGSDAIGAFVTGGTQGACVQGVEIAVNGNTGLISSTISGGTCSFFETLTGGAMSPTIGAALAPREPSAAPLGDGHAVAVVATTTTTAPCTQGQIWFEYAAPNVNNDGSEPTCTTTGSSLPAIVSLGGTTALAAWYQTSISTRTDPIGSCVGAKPAPLVLSLVNANTNPVVFSAPVTLTSDSISVRPPALVIPSSTSTSVLLAAPNGSDVGVWSLDATLKPSTPVSIPGLAGARAVSMATDGAGNIAVVAEIKCSPQSILLAVGSLAHGFSKITTVAGASGNAQVQPTVVWVQQQQSWIVSWIYVSGGPHARAMRFGPNGDAESGVIDPGVAASGAGALAEGNLLAYTSAGFVTAALGCNE